MGEPLVRLHELEVNVRLELERLQNVVQHLPVLGGGDKSVVEEVAALVQSAHHRGHLDALGPCADHGYDFDLLHFACLLRTVASSPSFAVVNRKHAEAWTQATLGPIFIQSSFTIYRPILKQ